MTQPIVARLTRAGLAKVFTASRTGIAVAVSHMALGYGRTGGVPGYQPSGAETALYNEFVRAPVAGGELIDASTIQIQAVIQQPVPAIGMAWEMGLFLADGTLFAVNASLEGPVTYVGAQETIILAAAIGLDEVPQGSVTWRAMGPNVNIMMAEPLTIMAAAVIATQTRILRAEAARVQSILPN